MFRGVAAPRVPAAARGGDLRASRGDTRLPAGGLRRGGAEYYSFKRKLAKTSCPYYNVKLSYVFLKFPLLTYSNHNVTFTNPKLTTIQ